MDDAKMARLEVDEKTARALDDDRRLFGTAFMWINAEGKVERIAPNLIHLKAPK